MIIAEVCRDGDAPTFLCRAAGKHVEQIFERPMQGREVRDSVEPRLVLASRPIWHACITQKLPIYSSFEVRDVENLPVTIEHLYLPYRLDTSDVGMVVAAFHAWSAERRFTRKGLLNDLTGIKPFPLFVVDPSIARPVEVDEDFEGL